MIAKLRKNFKLANVIVRILFVLGFVFANWQISLQATILVLGKSNLILGLFVDLVLGVALMFLLPPLINLILNCCKIYSVPRAEYCLLAHACFALGFFINGLLSLVNLFTPILLVWGAYLFPFISSLIAALVFYSITCKLYFNDVTRLYYFKMFAIIYLIIAVVVEVL